MIKTPEKIIRLSKSCLSSTERQAVMGVLEREFLGMGSEVQQFEQALTEFFGRPAVCVVNGTAALTRGAGRVLRLCQTGKIQTYVLAFLLGWVIFTIADRFQG